jgi:amidohydrolase
MMRVSLRSLWVFSALIALVYLQLLLISNIPLGSALPYVQLRKSEGENDNNSNNNNNNNSNNALRDAVIDGFDGFPRYRMHGSQRNNVVESFFSTSGSSGGNNNSSSSDDDALLREVRERANGIYDFLVYSRRFLHQHPELMYKEEITSAYVQKVLGDLDIKFTTGWGKNTKQNRISGSGGYGIVADIGTGGPPCVLLRADMDALPILERTEGVNEFKSQNNGKMHACGHDGHTTMLLGAANLLKSMENSINGTVRLMFQPAEEGGAGGKRMREEGVLTMDPVVKHAFGLHLWPTIPSGSVASRSGALLAAFEQFEILVSGVGGHAAMPHQTIDPIVAASTIVMNLQTIISRNLSPLESGVCSVTKFEAGDAYNVIPHSALLRGTIRALSTKTLLSLKDRVLHVVETTAAMHGCNVTIEWAPDFYPPTVNDPLLFESFSKYVGGMVAQDSKLTNIEPTMGAEDFAFLAEHVPSTFFLLGQGSGKSPDSSFGLHHPHFAIDESVLPQGVELHVNVALRALRKLADDEN